MVSSGGYFPQGAAVGLSNMGAFTPAALEMVSDRGAFTPAAPTVTHLGGAFVSAAPVGRQGRGVLHTPPLTGRKTRRNVSAFAPVGAPGGRMLLRPTWVHIHDKGVSASAALEMVSDSGAPAPAAAVGKFSARFSLLLAGIYWGFAPYSPPSFLPLMEEKKAKEDQGARGTGQVGRVRVGVGEGDREVGRVRVGGEKRGRGKGPGTGWGPIPISCSRRSAAACRLRVTGGSRWG